MKLKRSRVRAEAANPAAATSLLDQLSLNLPPPLRDGCATALGAAKSAIGALEERCVPVLSTAKVGAPEAGGSRRVAFPAPNRSLSFHPESLEPVTNRRVTQAQLASDMSNRRALLRQSPETIHIYVPFWRMHSTSRRDQPVLLQPVAHGGRMLARQLRDCIERKLLGQAFLQEPPLHGRIVAPQSDGNEAYCLRRFSCRRARCGRCVRRGRPVRG